MNRWAALKRPCGTPVSDSLDLAKTGSSASSDSPGKSRTDKRPLQGWLAAPAIFLIAQKKILNFPAAGGFA
jgi:hypothetical protein